MSPAGRGAPRGPPPRGARRQRVAESSAKRSTWRRTSITSVVPRYWCTSWTAIEPSPTAPATRLIDWWRTSPATNTPGRLVSSSSGGRSSGQRGRTPGARRSGPARMKPRSSRATTPASQSVFGRAPMKTKTAPGGHALLGAAARSASVSASSDSLAVGRGDLGARAARRCWARRVDAVDEVAGTCSAPRSVAADEDRHLRRRSRRSRAPPGRPSWRRRRRRPARRARERLGCASRRSRRPRPVSSSAPGTSRRRYWTPVATTTAWAGISSPPASRTARAGPARLEAHRVLHRQQLGAEALGLGRRAAGEVGAGQARRGSRGSSRCASSGRPGRRAPRARPARCAGPPRRRRPPPPARRARRRRPPGRRRGRRPGWACPPARRPRRLDGAPARRRRGTPAPAGGRGRRPAAVQQLAAPRGRARRRASGRARCCAPGSPSARATPARSGGRPRGRRRRPATPACQSESRSSSTG